LIGSLQVTRCTSTYHRNQQTTATGAWVLG
jgi:hypothetical protein